MKRALHPVFVATLAATACADSLPLAAPPGDGSDAGTDATSDSGIVGTDGAVVIPSTGATVSCHAGIDAGVYCLDFEQDLPGFGLAAFLDGGASDTFTLAESPVDGGGRALRVDNPDGHIAYASLTPPPGVAWSQVEADIVIEKAPAVNAEVGFFASPLVAIHPEIPLPSGCSRDGLAVTPNVAKPNAVQFLSTNQNAPSLFAAIAIGQPFHAVIATTFSNESLTLAVGETSETDHVDGMNGCELGPVLIGVSTTDSPVAEFAFRIDNIVFR